MDALQESQQIWDNIAGFWDDYVGEAGNKWHNVMIAPTTRQLLGYQAGERILDVACGNGQFSREMARAGVDVTAFDFSPTFIERAQAHTVAAGLSIEYHVMDATDLPQLLTLGVGRFDGMVANMALMDIADIRPIFQAAAQLLKPNGRFVFNVMHPCFNQTGTLRGVEKSNAGTETADYYIKTSRYLSLSGQPQRGLGIRSQPEPHLYFDRTLTDYLVPAFEAGLTLDGLIEPNFDEEKYGDETEWAELYKEIPALLVCRLRNPA